MRATYRNDEDVARLHIESLLARHRERVEAIQGRLGRIYVRRVARSLAGQAALGGAVLVVVAAAAAAESVLGILREGVATAALLGAWAMAALAYAAGRKLAAGRLRRALSREIERSGDVHADRARLEASAPEARVRCMIDAEERRSVALPLAGFAVLAPLTLHLVVYCLVSGWSLPWSALLEGFDGWVCLSLAIVGHVHVIVAYLAFRYARALHEAPTRVLADDPPPGALRALGYATLAACIPGLIFFVIPPILVAVTGAFVVPAFVLARERLLEERRWLDAQRDMAAAGRAR
ncbi:hypothetical protein [Sorangium sp. So ce176]|uniref:hypothetical protein n=1 Tax=Sorangium sp. So ce176 TaxID=3133286 RepID=UPI003F62A11C